LISRFWLKPVDTPVTKLLSNARLVPHSARVRFDIERGASTTLSLSILTAISGWMRSVCLPSLPLAVMVWPATSILTPLGTTTGCFPIRDIGLTFAP
jgi:hypothetical protein